MRKYPSVNMERARILDGPYASCQFDGCNGAFVIKYNGVVMKIMATDGTDEDTHNWEHVSVSCLNRTPKWSEMQWVKEQFWEDTEAVMQLHPCKDDYVNHHPYCLHMWRHRVIPTPAPPSVLVGPKK